MIRPSKTKEVEPTKTDERILRPDMDRITRWSGGHSMLRSQIMKEIILALLCLSLTAAAPPTSPLSLDLPTAERFARLALACVDKEYPNKLSHVLSSDGDVAPPRKLTPAFCGCYDWHSSVHGHWLLARLARTYPEAPFAKDARKALRRHLTTESLKTEAAYLRGPGRQSFERPYGLAWFLQLSVELHEWNDPLKRELS